MLLRELIFDEVDDRLEVENAKDGPRCVDGMQELIKLSIVDAQ